MTAQSHHLAYITVFILALATSGAQICVAGEMHLAKVPFSIQKYPSSEDFTAKKFRKKLDFESLEERFRSSRTISIFDKINIKSEVDELIRAISNFHHGKNNESVQTLRARFIELLAKVFALLQKDSELSQDLASSQDALWKMLLNPVRFAKQ